MRHTKTLSMILVAAACILAACAPEPPRMLVPRLRGEPSSERPPWLRDLPEQLERYPAPHGWGGDYLASLRNDVEQG
jgi:hypothetical protein